MEDDRDGSVERADIVRLSVASYRHVEFGIYSAYTGAMLHGGLPLVVSVTADPDGASKPIRARLEIESLHSG